MAIRYLFNTKGEYVAFIHNGNVFSPGAEWIGFIHNGNEFYRPDGAFAGYVLNDDRIARKRDDSPRPRLPRPFKPLRPFQPLRPLKRLRMPKLPPPYEDLFLAGIEGVPPGSAERQLTLEDLEGAGLFAADNTFLGKISRDQFDGDSLGNSFSAYGNQFNANSIFNQFGPYGNPYSSLSPYNEFTRTPPRIVLGDRTIAYVTVNRFVSPRVDPSVLLTWIRAR